MRAWWLAGCGVVDRGAGEGGERSNDLANEVLTCPSERGHGQRHGADRPCAVDGLRGGGLRALVLDGGDTTARRALCR